MRRDIIYSEIRKLTEKLDERKAEELAESILTNKVFTIEKKLKVDLKNNLSFGRERNNYYSYRIII